MKFLLMSFLLAGLVEQGFTCVDFSGNYTCTANLEEENASEVYDISIEQNGNTFTIIDDGIPETIIADGNTHNRPDELDIIDSSYMATCEGQSVLYSMNGKYIEDNIENPFDMNTKHTLLTSEKFESVTNIVFENLVVNEKTTCIKDSIEE